ncbi:hypothetical protein HanXRQr2_Chr16g0756011 [Helianthus annuus]|uniref:Uncharacterized protein n=1 Tax=Helianthus annuus TaxID=4232 RepID=A0A251U301_HELAN|nr:uncharacterized protein LOC110872200 isoform X4 [Helianthus annuus]XP_022017411.1 uncharacterized protein LOC110917101 isoform X4 [Helianthus annuus]KAF5760658.1 hypothetical protein HanXRQr2_Chr16g0756011 [Helianthus annuus]KAJ0443501.1 hypothetical protein HanIR_Chr16g0821441 [Helianthus annuus]
MLNFRIKNGYFLGSRVPTTISATHLKMHALFWSTLQQGKDIIPTRKPLVTISSIRYKGDLCISHQQTITSLLYYEYKTKIEVADIGV